MADINEFIGKYVQLRDTIEKLDREHKEKMKPYREMLDQLGTTLLAHLNEINSDSIATQSGTVYRTTKKSATIADAGAFWEYVVSGANWDLIDKRANVTAVSAYVEEHKTLPPGINYSTTSVVGVRRK